MYTFSLRIKFPIFRNPRITTKHQHATQSSQYLLSKLCDTLENKQEKTVSCGGSGSRDTVILLFGEAKCSHFIVVLGALK